MTLIIDSHSHIHHEEFDVDREECLQRMSAEEVGTILVGCSLDSSKKAVQLAEVSKNTWATIGLHPTETAEYFLEEDYLELLASPKVVGVGECGLDYFRLSKDTEELEKQRQEKNFRVQIECAIKYNKGLMLHVRPSKGTEDAHIRALEILSEYKSNSNLRGTSHFFTSGIEIAKKYIELGFCVSIPGVVTFAPELESMVKEIPLTSILIETDSPYASPVPYRGKRNEPIFVKKVAEKIANIKGLSVDEVIHQTFHNTSKMFLLN